jgi:hypothetical protein
MKCHWSGISTFRLSGVWEVEETSDFWNREFQTPGTQNPEKGSLFQNLGIGAVSELGSRITNSWYVESRKAIDRAFHGTLIPFRHFGTSEFGET